MYHDFNYEATLASSLRAAWNEVRKTRGELTRVDEEDEGVIETPGGWQP